MCDAPPSLTRRRIHTKVAQSRLPPTHPLASPTPCAEVQHVNPKNASDNINQSRASPRSDTVLCCSLTFCAPARGPNFSTCSVSKKIKHSPSFLSIRPRNKIPPASPCCSDSRSEAHMGRCWSAVTQGRSSTPLTTLLGMYYQGTEEEVCVLNMPACSLHAARAKGVSRYQAALTGLESLEFRPLQGFHTPLHPRTLCPSHRTSRFCQTHKKGYIEQPAQPTSDDQTPPSEIVTRKVRR
jgi:hypothetical protein